MLVNVGLTPLQALQSATVNPALFFHREREMGRVSPGMLADLVVLDADPIVDIHNANKISAVIVNGKLLDRRALNSLLTTRGGN